MSALTEILQGCSFALHSLQLPEIKEACFFSVTIMPLMSFYFKVYSIYGSVAFFQIYVGDRLRRDEGTIKFAMDLHV